MIEQKIKLEEPQPLPFEFELPRDSFNIGSKKFKPYTFIGKVAAIFLRANSQGIVQALGIQDVIKIMKENFGEEIPRYAHYTLLSGLKNALPKGHSIINLNGGAGRGKNALYALVSEEDNSNADNEVDTTKVINPPVVTKKSDFKYKSKATELLEIFETYSKDPIQGISIDDLTEITYGRNTSTYRNNLRGLIRRINERISDGDYIANICDELRRDEAVYVLLKALYIKELENVPDKEIVKLTPLNIIDKPHPINRTQPRLPQIRNGRMDANNFLNEVSDLEDSILNNMDLRYPGIDTIEAASIPTKGRSKKNYKEDETGFDIAVKKFEQKTD